MDLPLTGFMVSGCKQTWTSNAVLHFYVVAVEEIASDMFLAAVMCVLDVNFFFFGGVQQPFIHKQRLLVTGSISQRWNGGDRIFGKIVGVIHKMTGRGNGERCERIDVGDVVKQLAKLQKNTVGEYRRRNDSRLQSSQFNFKFLVIYSI